MTNDNSRVRTGNIRQLLEWDWLTLGSVLDFVRVSQSLPGGGMLWREQRAPSIMVASIYLPFVGQQFVNHTTWHFLRGNYQRCPTAHLI
jgi:hypothetical protein